MLVRLSRIEELSGSIVAYWTWRTHSVFKLIYPSKFGANAFWRQVTWSTGHHLCCWTAKPHMRFSSASNLIMITQNLWVPLLRSYCSARQGQIWRSGLLVYFCGISVGQKGWFVHDLSAGEYFLSRDVVFSKKEFPYVVSHISPLTVMHISQVRRWLTMADRESSNTIKSEMSHVEQEPSGYIHIEPQGSGHRESKRSVRRTDYVTYSVCCLLNPPHATRNQILIFRQTMLLPGEYCFSRWAN